MLAGTFQKAELGLPVLSSLDGLLDTWPTPRSIEEQYVLV
jgi:hypothetical protein